MTRRLQSGDVIPVTLLAWIVQDGAQPYPDHGERVSYALEFVVTRDRFREDSVEARAVAEPTGAPEHRGRVPTWLDFGALTAIGYLDQPTTGEIAIVVGLAVDYEIADRTTGRCVGTVVRRRLVTLIKDQPDSAPRTELVDLAPGEKPGFRNTSRPTIEIHADGTWTTHPAPDTWECATGLLLDIELT
ncbi:hypothetical protein [Gordonia phthalatica]|uniref:Uncharacterized protein n=1 Tax=Gordonia phthalatica TaxID=1136941 RepID=A0A0N9MNC4_9ACTN|nr:hypothetical protein [Gordonia phthalatica]ALG83573.1 hypothetical protein ACH46_02425 [Gordonia phthalatica]